MSNSLDAKVDAQVTIEGTARNASAGAIVMMDDRTPVYVDGLERWDAATAGKQISANGTLRKRGGDPVVNAKGEHSHGIPDGRFVLEKSTWKLG